MDWRQAEREYDDEIIGESTIPELVLDAADRWPDTVAQRYKGGVYDRTMSEEVFPEAPHGEYVGITYAEMADVVRTLAAGFRELGVGADDRVGIYSDSRMEWAHADVALQAAGGVVTTVYTESAAPQVEYLLGDPGAMGVVVENRELLDVLDEVRENLVDLEFVVAIDDPGSHGDRDDVYTLAEVHELGVEAFDEETFRSWLDEREWTELSSLVYTSGTTGDPKGVELTHENWRTAINQVRKRLGPRPDKGPDVPTLEHGKTALSFLPLAHAFERFNHFNQLGTGMTIAYAESPDTISDDIQKVRPDSAASVPRVYERIFDQMRAQASDSSVRKRIFEWAVATGQAYDRADDPGLWLETKLAVADRLVFSQVREALGGNIEMFVSGGGSLSEDLARLYRAMGLTIVEGYGLTETAPIVSLNPPEDIRVGTMGPAFIHVETQLDDTVVAPETEAGVEGEVGELLVRGPNVTEGYWNKPDETEASFTEDGWFRTGDVVARDEDGYFRFVDRVKQLIVLDTGKNVAPEPIEDRFSTSARVDQIMVVGDDEKFIGAVVVPNFEQLRSWADDEGIDLPADPAAAIEDDRVVDWVGAEVDRVNQQLPEHERIKEFRLVTEEWTADNDLLTPSMKKKRRNIVDAYEEQIADIYGKEPAAVSPT